MKQNAFASGCVAGLVALSILGVLAPIAGARAGSIESFHYRCPALGRDQVAEVYIPSVPVKGRERWPVLYLLHGLHGRSTDWDSLGHIKTTLDRLISERRIKPILVVMPDGGDSWYVDSASVDGPGDYATAIGQDVQQAVEGYFPVWTDRAHRAIGGISMGGYGALRLALMAPERYAAVAAMSPAIWQNVPGKPEEAGPHDRAASVSYFQKIEPATVTIGVDLPPDGRHFGGAFGTPFDPKRFNAANVFTLLQSAVDAKVMLPAVYVSVGDDDSHLLWRGSIAFFETMQMNGRDIDFRVTDGDHNWDLWQRTLTDSLVFIDATLGRVPVR